MTAEIKIGSEWQFVEVVCGKLRTEPTLAGPVGGFVGKIVDTDYDDMILLEDSDGLKFSAERNAFLPDGYRAKDGDGGWLVPVYGDDYEPKPGDLIEFDGELIPAEAT